MTTTGRPGAARWVPSDADIDALRAAAPDCAGCELYRDASHVVFSAGPSAAELMLVGEQPGDQEDRQGRPFVGPAGRVLADAVDAAGIDRQRLYVTNAVKHFRFERRGSARIHKTPDVAHITACNPWLEAELAAVRPRLVVALGATAGRALLHRAVRIGAERGAILPAGDGPDVLVTTHPSAVLRVRGTPEWDAAFDGLVRDLTTAKDAVAAA